MEAIAMYEFSAMDVDELSFKKGQILKVLDMEYSDHWYLAEREGKEGLIPSNHIVMENHDWYFGCITRLEAEEMLIDEYEGAFLVRVSGDSPKDFAMSVKFSNVVQHFKVLRHPKGMFSLGKTKFTSLNELIKHHRSASVSRSHDVKLRNMSYEEEEEEVEEEEEEEEEKEVEQEFLVQAKFNFNPQEEGELELRCGDVIIVLDRSDKNWWEGELRGRRGCFPVTYVGPYHP